MLPRPSLIFCTGALLLGAVFAPVLANAEGFMARLFTFREEQKALVQPQGAAGGAPRMVYQPNYPSDDHVAWSRFYTRTDLLPKDYLGDPSTKVMRPPTPQVSAAATPAQAQGGWAAINEQARENNDLAARSTESNVIIGEPGEGPGMVMYDGNVGAATRIGEPVQSWRVEGTINLTARPGDFDYRLSDTPRAALPSLADGGGADGEMVSTPASRIAEANRPSERQESPINPAWKNDPRYTEFNTQGQVTGYRVQAGDTLGEIAAQEAIYGRSQLWPLIYSANRQAIGANPNNLKRNQNLTIPRDYTEQQAKDAEARAARGR